MPFKLKANARGIVICQKSGKFKYWKIKITFIQGILFCFFVAEEKKAHLVLIMTRLWILILAWAIHLKDGLDPCGFLLTWDIL